MMGFYGISSASHGLDTANASISMNKFNSEYELPIVSNRFQLRFSSTPDKLQPSEWVKLQNHFSALLRTRPFALLEICTNDISLLLHG